MNLWSEIERLPRQHRLALARQIVRQARPTGLERRKIVGRTLDASYQTKCLGEEGNVVTNKHSKPADQETPHGK